MRYDSDVIRKKQFVVEQEIYSEPHWCQKCRALYFRGCRACRYTGKISYPKCKCGKLAVEHYAPLGMHYTWNWYCQDCVVSWAAESGEYDRVKWPRLPNKHRKFYRAYLKSKKV